MQNEQFLKDLHAFMQSKGFVYGPFPEIYNGISGFYAYGPLGKLLKNKIENSVRSIFFSNGFRELECPTVVPDIVWEASGHLNTFTDQTVECSKCKYIFRVDKLIEEVTNKETASWSDKQFLETIKKEKLPLYTSHHQEKQLKVERITLEDALKHKHIKSKAYAWCLHLAYKQFLSMGIPAEQIRIRQHLNNERAFYADDAWDIEIKLNTFGWTECCGVHDRTDYDLKKHAEFSKQSLEAVRENGEKYVPHILEIAFGTDRPCFTLMDLFYEKKEEGEGKSMFKVPYHMAPIDCAIFPLQKKDNLPEHAEKVKELLERDFIVDFDESGSIGKRYLRAAEAGTPYAITIDYDSLKENTVTLRDRDSEKQIRVEEKELKETLRKLLSGERNFSEKK